MNGIVKLGTWVREGDILVRKVTPIGKQQLTPYQKFLYVIVDKQIPSVKDTAVRQLSLWIGKQKLAFLCQYSCVLYFGEKTHAFLTQVNYSWPS